MDVGRVEAGGADMDPEKVEDRSQIDGEQAPTLQSSQLGE